MPDWVLLPAFIAGSFLACFLLVAGPSAIAQAIEARRSRRARGRQPLPGDDPPREGPQPQDDA